MARGETPKLFHKGRKIRRAAEEVPLDPITAGAWKWFAELDRAGAGEVFMREGRKQPKAQRRNIFR